MTPRVESACVFAPNQVLLPEISYKAFTYPGDEEALTALRNIPGAAPLLTYLQENFTEQMIYVRNNEQMIKAGENSYRSLYKLTERCCEILSCPMPDLYITTNPNLNAYTVGQRRTCIVLHSGLVEQLTLDELSFVIGHEVGHIKCAHGLYRMLGDLLLQYWDAVTSVIPIPGLGLLRIPLLLAYWEWYRRAEFTCDRAGLLCIQTIEPALTALAKLAGKVAGYEDEFHLESAIQQHEVYKDVNKLVMVIAILENAGNTHPFIPVRLKQLREYSQGEDYKRILSGDYARDALGIHEGGMRVACACGTLINVKLKFCPQCGRATKADPAAAGTCPGCSSQVAPGMRFCAKCGSKLDVPEQPAVSDLDRLKNMAGSFFKR